MTKVAETLCYLCGEPGASVSAIFTDKFTSHVLARAPESNKLCACCNRAINQNLWYWNANKEHKETCECALCGGKSKKEKVLNRGMWSMLSMRNSSWLLSEDVSYPVILEPSMHWPDEPSPAKKKQACSLPVVRDLPTRIQLREWITKPPQPPFEIVIAESGQKHLLPWSEKARDRERFPVMFELDQVYVERAELCDLLEVFESLMKHGFTKAEILSGDYRSDRIIKCGLNKWSDLDSRIQSYRGMRLLELVGHVANREDDYAN